MKQRLIWIGSLTMLGLAYGCGQKPAMAPAADTSAQPTIAVVDLDKAATDLGWMSEMQSNMVTLQKNLSDEYQNAQNSYTDQINAKIKEFGLHPGDHPTQAQQQVLGQMAATGRQALGELQQKANQEFSDYKGQWIKEYRDAVSPIVRKIATDRKVLVVLNKSDTMIYSDPTIDITDAVVDAGRDHPPTLATVPVPTLPDPSSMPSLLSGSTQPSGGTTTQP